MNHCIDFVFYSMYECTGDAFLRGERMNGEHQIFIYFTQNPIIVQCRLWYFSTFHTRQSVRRQRGGERERAEQPLSGDCCGNLLKHSL